ncbi:MAG: DUF2058 family protein [Proteobacteria bacterium]|nr:DUF2058 family protein [Pseudomonadota bacterium]
MPGESLQSQLIKAGLATAADARKVDRQKKVAKARDRKDGKSESDSREKIAKAKVQKAERAKENRSKAVERNQVVSQHALMAQIRQIVKQNDQRDLKAKDAEHPYQFVHGKKVKRIYVTEAHRNALIKGSLAIINCDGTYHFLEREPMEQVRKRDPKWIVSWADPDAKAAEPDPEDPYAKFQVPDDLDW